NSQQTCGQFDLKGKPMAQDLSNPYKSEVGKEDRFLFDLQGFLILKNALTPEECAGALQTLRRLESADYDDAEWMKYNRSKNKPRATGQAASGARASTACCASTRSLTATSTTPRRCHFCANSWAVRN